MADITEIILNGTTYELASDSGGISSVAQSLLINILRNAVYTTDQSTNITNLETELASGGGSSTVAIINTLTNCTSNNSASSITVGSSYIATITANTGYDIESASVTMGGTDVTLSVYSAGVITIPNVTGTLVITVTAATQADTGLAHYWNFTSGSLVDTIDGETEVILDGAASIASVTGVTMSAKTDGITLPFDSTIVKAKITFGAFDRTAFGNERLIGIKNSASSTSYPALRYSNTNSVWETSDSVSTGITSPTAFEDNELVLERDGNNFNILFSGETIVANYSTGGEYNYVQIGGGSNGSGFYTFVVESIKTYVEVSE